MTSEDWISVDVKLPPLNVYVLAWSTISNVAAIVKYKGTHWSSSSINIQNKHVKYWMHITPPKDIELKPHDWKFGFTKRESQDN
jgi:hypothetical protein